MTREEILDELDEIARHDKSSTARIAALKMLLAEQREDKPADPFADLDGGDVVEFRQRQAS